MKKPLKIKPTEHRELNFEDFRAEISQAWERRAKELQDRRWRLIKNKELHRRLVL
jgi:NAD dependent epimerase/dehydratase family enzyme